MTEWQMIYRWKTDLRQFLSILICLYTWFQYSNTKFRVLFWINKAEYQFGFSYHVDNALSTIINFHFIIYIPFSYVIFLKCKYDEYSFL